MRFSTLFRLQVKKIDATLICNVIAKKKKKTGDEIIVILCVTAYAAVTFSEKKKKKDQLSITYRSKPFSIPDVLFL